MVSCYTARPLQLSRWERAAAWTRRQRGTWGEWSRLGWLRPPNRIGRWRRVRG